jgi:hypothetical protein
MPADMKPTFVTALAFDCNGRPLRGAQILITFSKSDGTTKTVSVLTEGGRFRPASLLFHTGLQNPYITVRATYRGHEPENPVCYGDASKPFYCEFVFHLVEGEEPPSAGNRARKRRRNWRCRCELHRSD